MVASPVLSAAQRARAAMTSIRGTSRFRIQQIKLLNGEQQRCQVLRSIRDMTDIVLIHGRGIIWGGFSEPPVLNLGVIMQILQDQVRRRKAFCVSAETRCQLRLARTVEDLGPPVG